MKVLSVLVWKEGVNALVWTGSKAIALLLKFHEAIFSAASLGSTPVLPAESCEEIKISEGRDAVSGTWWLGNGSGEATLAYCDMREPEGMIPNQDALRSLLQKLLS